MTFAWIAAEKAEFPSPETLSDVARLAQRLLCVARAPGINACARRPSTESAGAGVLRREQPALRESARPRGSPRATRACQPQTGRALDAGSGPAGAAPQALQGDDDERSRSAGRSQSARSRLHGGPRRINGGSATRRSSSSAAAASSIWRRILDLFSRFIVGWAVSASNDRQVTIKALQMALKRRCPDAGLVHHSDQGCTYASEDYQDVLDTHGITCSMSRRGNCYDNAVMERASSRRSRASSASTSRATVRRRWSCSITSRCFTTSGAAIQHSARSARPPLSGCAAA